MSFLPGLGLSAPTAADAPSSSSAPTHAQPNDAPVEPRRIDLSPGSEWRFEVPFDASVTVRLLPSVAPQLQQVAGSTTRPPTAELFGTELAPSRSYTFSNGAKAAIYTHHGCSLELSGPGLCDSEYVADETPMTEYTNLHFALEKMRDAAAGTTGGPRVLILGPADAGKTSLLKLLAAYATRSGRTPLVCSLDPRDAPFSLPGSISATVLGAGSLLDVEDAASGGWGSSPIAGPSAVPVKVPLVYHYGFEKAEERPDIFKPVATRLALAASSRFEDDATVKQAGMLLELGGSVVSGPRAARDGYDIVQHVVGEFSVNVLLVLGSERLYSDMSRRFASRQPATGSGDEQVHVVKLSKSGGCVDRDADHLRLARDQRVKAYFYGGARTTLSPHAQLVDFDALQLLRLVDERDANAQNSNFLPGDSLDDQLLTPPNSAKPAIFESGTPTAALEHRLVAVKHAAPTDPQASIRDAAVASFVWLADCDTARRRAKLLSPIGGRLPLDRALVAGAWPEVGGDVLG